MRAILKTSVLLGLLAVASAPGLHAAGRYPDHPVKVIVPFPAGGVTDIATRVIAQRLSERLGQQFYVENIGGAGGISEWQMQLTRRETATPSCSRRRALW
jgi:tripartite-type tricarboxylate transporter receptor subunit TctC